jgi:hypothetical protein
MRPGVRRPAVAVVAVSADDRTPTVISIGVGSVAVVAAALLAALMPAAYTGWRFAMVALAVGVFAVLTRDSWAVAAVAASGWLVVNGFLVNRMGELSWHGSPDLLRLMALVSTAAIGGSIGEGVYGLREWRARWRAGALAQALARENEEKERRDA